MNLLENASLKPHNTFGIDVLCDFFIEVKNIDELAAALRFAGGRNLPILPLGGGSNVLFTRNFRGVVLKNALRGIEVVKSENSRVHVKAAAGENWHGLVLWCIEHQLAGIENLSLIPGCVGAAPMQNIGAYGVELKDVFVELEAFDLECGEIKVFTKEDCHFGYRESVFKHELRSKFFITSVTLQLHNLNVSQSYAYHTDYGDIKAELAEMKVFDPSLKAVSDAVIKIRTSKLPNPAELGNAGSFFKNPVISSEQFERLKAEYPLMPSYPAGEAAVKVPAGWLIEQCGWKGKRVGNTGAHARQALVLVNYGNASGEEVKALAGEIQSSVFAKFKIAIEPEVNVY